MKRKVGIDDVVAKLKETPMTREELAKAFECTESTIYKTLKNKLPEGISLSVAKEGKTKRYSVVEGAASEVPAPEVPPQA